VNASYEWLKSFLPLTQTPAEVRDLLTAHAVTVDEIVGLRADLAAIVIGRVVEAGPHPDSDHLWLTKVDAGTGQLLEVVCGAPIVKTGALYPFAGIGTTLPNGITIERRKIRGIYSNGMLCSARELALGEDHAGIMELDVAATPGTPFLDAVQVGDTRLVIDVGANRPDLLSHQGIARELAAILKKPWHLPEIPNLGAQTPNARRVPDKGKTADVEVRVEPDTDTRRYLGAVIRGVEVAQSPDWLVRRLDAVGVRSISNVVDATNYVLHELGQPIHAFDLDKLSGAVVVRRAKAGEKLVTLDGQQRSLSPDAVVIADQRAAQAVAGVMGGRDSEIGAGTKNLFIEVASFDPRSTRTTRKRLGLHTDASHRFERGVDPELGPIAMDRVVRLILSLAGGQLAEAPIDVAGPTPPARELTVRMSRAEKVLGAPVPIDIARKQLESIGFDLISKTDRELNVRVPSWRADVTSEIDLVEEIARLYGFDKFPTEIRPYRPTSTFDDPHWTLADRLRDVLVGLGLYESRPVPFVKGHSDKTHIRVENPIAENEAYLRSSLLETLARSAELNLAQRVGDVRLFEIGSTFTPRRASVVEAFCVGALIMGRRRPPHFTEPQPPAFDEWDIKMLATRATETAFPGATIQLTTHNSAEKLLMPTESGGEILWNVWADKDCVGVVLRLNLDAPVWAAQAYGLEIILDTIDASPTAEAGQHSYMEGRRPTRRSAAKFRPLPTMPAAEFDLALLVPVATTVADVERVIRDSAGELLERLELFDQYAGAGVEADHRSLAWRLTFRHPDRTLRDKEIEGRRGKILSALQQELHVRQRTA
jgi:phenylalanyl-tRNA synthetase beta chain